MHDVESVLKSLKSLGNPANREGMSRFGINTERAFGVPIPALRSLARDIGRDHGLALKLWDSGYHEARLLAGFIGDPARLTEEQMESWVRDFDSWDICDQVCSNLFDRAGLAWAKALEWPSRDEEFVKRAGFVLMAALAVHAKQAPDRRFLDFLPIIEREAPDQRNFVKKAVNWALRQIGKRNPMLNREAIRAAEAIGRMDSSTARWIASDALRELRSSAVQARLSSQASD
jgi:3-methyladenine DNA glycosylase AlkD